MDPGSRGCPEALVRTTGQGWAAALEVPQDPSQGPSWGETSQHGAWGMRRRGKQGRQGCGGENPQHSAAEATGVCQLPPHL